MYIYIWLSGNPLSPIKAAGKSDYPPSSADKETMVKGGLIIIENEAMVQWVNKGIFCRDGIMAAEISHLPPYVGDQLPGVPAEAVSEASEETSDEQVEEDTDEPEDTIEAEEMPDKPKTKSESKSIRGRLSRSGRASRLNDDD